MRFLVAAAQLSSCRSLAIPKEFSPHNAMVSRSRVRQSFAIALYRITSYRLRTSSFQRCRAVSEIIRAKLRNTAASNPRRSENKNRFFCERKEEKERKRKHTRTVRATKAAVLALI